MRSGSVGRRAQHGVEQAGEARVEVLAPQRVPPRRAVLAATDEQPSCGAFDLPVTKSTCTHHFKVLREAGVISQRHRGTARLNSLRRGDLDARFPGLLDSVLRAA